MCKRSYRHCVDGYQALYAVVVLSEQTIVFSFVREFVVRYESVVLGCFVLHRVVCVL